jgi:hypothetical protein
MLCNVEIMSLSYTLLSFKSIFEDMQVLIRGTTLDRVSSWSKPPAILPRTKGSGYNTIILYPAELITSKRPLARELPPHIICGCRIDRAAASTEIGDKLQYAM